MDKERIKKALEDHSIRKLKYQDGIKIKEIEFMDILTLINELEKENGELKQDLKKSIDTQKGMLDSFKTATKEVEENLAREIPNLLKHFAERLKEKIKNFCGTEYENAYYEVSKSFACSEIDETLKEFLK